MHASLNIARRAAANAGKLIRNSLPRMEQLIVEEKNTNDFVTEIDRQSEAAITEVILEAFPDHALLAEESGAVGENSEWQWIIDPLDGTSNFIHGVPHYSISIACMHHGVAESAVVLDIMRGQEFSASRGNGAWLDGKRIRVSGRDSVARALVCTGVPTLGRGIELRRQYFECLQQVSAQCSGIRRSGSAALDLAWVASGWFDAFFEIGLSPWDMAAGALLIREAGGLVSNFHGDPDFLDDGNILCGTPKCYRALLPLIQSELSAIPPRQDAAGAVADTEAGTEAEAGVEVEAGTEAEATAGTEVEAEAGTEAEATAGAEVEAEVEADTDAAEAGTDAEVSADSPQDAEELPPQTTTAAIERSRRMSTNDSDHGGERGNWKPRQRDFGSGRERSGSWDRESDSRSRGGYRDRSGSPHSRQPWQDRSRRSDGGGWNRSEGSSRPGGERGGYRGGSRDHAEGGERRHGGGPRGYGGGGERRHGGGPRGYGGGGERRHGGGPRGYGGGGERRHGGGPRGYAGGGERRYGGGPRDHGEGGERRYGGGPRDHGEGGERRYGGGPRGYAGGGERRHGGGPRGYAGGGERRHGGGPRGYSGGGERRYGGGPRGYSGGGERRYESGPRGHSGSAGRGDRPGDGYPQGPGRGRPHRSEGGWNRSGGPPRGGADRRRGGPPGGRNFGGKHPARRSGPPDRGPDDKEES